MGAIETERIHYHPQHVMDNMSDIDPNHTDAVPVSIVRIGGDKEGVYYTTESGLGVPDLRTELQGAQQTPKPKF